MFKLLLNNKLKEINNNILGKFVNILINIIFIKFIINKKELGINHPPKKKITNIHEFNNIFVYSPKKNKAKLIAEYSKL